MKKLLLTSLAAAALSLASLSASAAAVGATVSGNYTVSVILSPLCKVTTNNPTVNFGTYTAFQTNAAAGVATGPIIVSCTRGLAAPVLAFDTPGASVGLLAGLNYTLGGTAGAGAVTAVTVAGAAADGTAGSGAATTHSYTITGNMPAGQAGACTTAGSLSGACNGGIATTDATRTVTFTY